MKKSIKVMVIAVILSLVMILQVLPVSAFVSLAEELNQPADATEFISDSDEKPAEDAYILFEDENKRELSSKQFRMSDGSFMAVSYPEQVHFIDSDGKYADIDNRFIYSEAKEENDFSGYSNRSNSFDIKFNEVLLTENAVIYRLTKGDHTLSLERIQGENSYISNANANATVTQAKDDAEPFEKEGDAAGELAFVSSNISYSNEENKVDFDYVLVGNHINEYIVIKEKLDTYTFTYRIDADGLTAEKDENGGIVFTDNSGETIYSIPAPFMYDSNGVYSDTVDYELTEADGAYILTVQADESWINEEDRVFPVTIDPDLYIGKYNSSDVDDKGIWSGDPDSDHTSHNDQYMYCGYSNTSYEHDMRIYVKLNSLPSLPDAAVIVDARLNMKQLQSFSDPARPVFVGETAIDFAAKRITSSWTESTLKWSNKPSVNSTILDYRTATSSTHGCYLAFDITEAAIMWYDNPNINHGIEISTMEALNGYHYTYFCSSENPNQYITVLPLFKLSYRDNKGIEDYWTFHSASASDAGTVYVNDFSGNTVVLTEIFTTPGNIMPISIGLAYNNYLAGYYFSNSSADGLNGHPEALTGYFGKMIAGAGFKLNIQETVIYKNINGDKYLVHSDTDGTEHYYFEGSNDVYYSEDGLGWKIKKNDYSFEMTDDYGNKKTFYYLGHIMSEEDAYGNKITYGLDLINNRISSITSKPANSTETQVVTIEYNTDGTIYRIVFGTDYYYFTYATYSGIKYLEQIRESVLNNGIRTDARIINYDYDPANGRLTEVSSATIGRSVEITYDDTTGKALKLTEKANNTEGQSIAFEYYDYKKTQIITSGLDDYLDYNPNGDNTSIDDIFTTYVFDHFGRTITVYTTGPDGNIVSASNAAYNTETGKSKAVNGISKSGSVGASSINLLKNTSFESGYTNWSGVQLNGSYEITESQSFIGKKSAKLSIDDNTSAVAVFSQQVSLVTGKTYTLSAYVKTASVAGDGAYLYVSGITGAESMKLTGTTDSTIQNGWQRIYCTFTPSATQSYYVYLYLRGTSGTAYFDAVQLEEGSIGAYNLLENGAFINGSTGWTFAGSAFAGVSSYAPEYAVWLPGNHSGSVTATQTVQLNMPINTTYMLSAWAVGNSADIDVFVHTVGANNNVVDYDQKTRTFQVKATIYYYTSSNTLSSTTTEGIAKFNSDTNQLQYSITPVVPNIDPDDPPAKQAYAVIEVSYNNNVNYAQVLNVSLTAEPAQTYSYDVNGNLSGVQNADGNTPAYKFTNGVDLDKITNSDGSGYDITYNTTTHKPLAITDKNNVKATYGYDSYGNVTSVTVTPSSGSGSILTQTTYKNDGRFVETVTDERGKVTTYDYNTSTGLLNYVKDANNNQTQYKYNIFKAITDVFADIDKDGTADSNEAKVSYVYDNNRNLTQIVTRTTTYNLTYDSFGNVSTITVGSSSTPLVSYTYADHNGKLTGTTYANGTCVQNVYDALDRTVEIKYNGTVRYSVTYDKSGSVSSIYDHENEIEYLYEYDRLGRLIRYYEAEDGVIRTVSVEQYDDKGRTSKVTYKNDGYNARETSYNYDSTGRLYTINLPSNEYTYLGYDSFGRQNFRSYYKNAGFVMGITNGYESNTFSGASHTSSTINSVTYNFYINNTSLRYDYGYSNTGNITSVRRDSTLRSEYSYDSLNQLVYESNFEAGKRFIYEYDDGGNITSVRTLNSATYALENTDTYSYTDTNWKDKLTAYNGVTITYDALGNPLSYYNGSSYTFTWKDGRRLATLNTGSTSVSYKYNSDGIRYEKTVNGVVHKYYLMGSTITAETIIDGTNTTHIEYFYDSYGPYGFSIDGTFYYYIKNLQGDVMQIRDENNNLIASYVYDAWGKVLSVTENNNSNIGAKNAIRYRGYYYDTESNLYYLNARYYDPQIKRFISADEADVVFASTEALTDKNLFAYCDNNPIFRRDDDGDFWHIIAGAIVGGICGAVSSIVDQVLSGNGIDGWKVLASAGIGAIEGALITAVPAAGAVIGAACGVLGECADAAIDLCEEKDVSCTEFLVNATVSGTVGAITGSWGGSFSKGMFNSDAKAVKTAVKSGVNSVKSIAKKNTSKAIKYAARKVVPKVTKAVKPIVKKVAKTVGVDILESVVVYGINKGSKQYINGYLKKVAQ